METIYVEFLAEVPENFTGIANDKYGNKFWYKEGKLHRDDGPAVEYANGDKHWFIEGLRDRDDGPAIEYADGTKHWLKEGNLHRENGPAIEFYDGTKYWFKEGKLNREDGPAYEDADGNKVWYLNGVVFNSETEMLEALRIRQENPNSYETKLWYQEAKYLRYDGRDIVGDNGRTSWYKEAKPG